MKIKVQAILASIFLMFCIEASSQTDIAAQVQLYPTGLIPGVKIDHSIGTYSRLSFRLGANIFDHRDLGFQEMEEGSGFGFSVGYQYYFNSGFEGLHVELKNDVWWNSVDWQTDNFNGTTDIVVLQPTLNLGYTMFWGSSFFISPSLGFGWEWNARVSGAPTGQGAIGLIGLSAGVRL